MARPERPARPVRPIRCHNRCVDRDVEIEHMAHCFDVEAPRCHIGADQKFYFAFLEGFERVGSLKLIHITVE